MCDWFGHWSLRPLCKGASPGWVFFPPAHLSWFPVESTCLALLQDPHPQGSFQHEEDAAKYPYAVSAIQVAVGLVPLSCPPASSHVWPPEPERPGVSLAWPRVSHVTLGRYFNLFASQSVDMSNVGNYGCFTCHSMITQSLRGITLHSRHRTGRDELQLVSAVSRWCSPAKMLLGWVSTTW